MTLHMQVLILTHQDSALPGQKNLGRQLCTMSPWGREPHQGMLSFLKGLPATLGLPTILLVAVLRSEIRGLRAGLRPHRGFQMRFLATESFTLM